MSRDDPQLKVRVPEDVMSFLHAETRRYRSSLASEVTRSIRNRMEKVQREEMPASSNTGQV